MLNKKIIFAVLIITCGVCNSCRKNEISESLDAMKNITKITVTPIITTHGKVKPTSFDKYFKSWKLIALETNKDYLLGMIDRIVHYKNQYFILDRHSAAVFVFDENGKAAFKIRNKGQGPGEWVGLMDFTIDEEHQQVILHSDRPSKLIYFTMEGRFLRETETDNYYRNVAWCNNKLFLFNTHPDLQNLLFVKSDNTENLNGFLVFSKKNILFQNTGVPYPNLINSKSLYFDLPYSNIIYECKPNGVIPKYGIDFGRKNIPADFFDKGHRATQLIVDSYKNDYGFAIANFKETKNYVIFSYAGNIMVIYDKKRKTTETFNLIENKGKINFENYFANDGNDECIMAPYISSAFLDQMKIYKSNPLDWLQIPDYIKNIYLSTTKSSNPLLLIYNFK